jgi:hypothetical protein
MMTLVVAGILTPRRPSVQLFRQSLAINLAVSSGKRGKIKV